MMNRCRALSCFGGLALLAASARADLLVNGGLELATGETFRSVNGGQTYQGWRVPTGPNIEFVGTTTWDVAQGTGAIDLNGVQGAGGIYQDVTTVAGQTYTVRFALSGNPNTNGELLNPKSLNILWNGVSAGSFTFTHLPGDAWRNMRWLYMEAIVVGTGLDRLTFQSTTTATPAAGPAIDDITLTPSPVPEPATLGVLGLGALALVRRRRR